MDGYSNVDHSWRNDRQMEHPEIMRMASLDKALEMFDNNAISYICIVHLSIPGDTHRFYSRICIEMEGRKQKVVKRHKVIYYQICCRCHFFLVS